MKKISVIAFMLCVIFALSGCTGDKQNEENTSESNESTSEDSSNVLNAEDYSFDVKEPDFAVPYTFSDIENYMSLPAYEYTKKDGQKELFYNSDVLVYEKKYDESENIVSVTVYEADGTTPKALYEYIYNDNNEKSVDIDYYIGGETFERRMFNFYENGNIKSIYLMGTDAETAAPIVNAYEYNQDGTIKQYLSSDNFNQIILDAIMQGLQG